jgi:hypothetical protein
MRYTYQVHRQKMHKGDCTRGDPRRPLPDTMRFLMCSDMIDVRLVRFSPRFRLIRVGSSSLSQNFTCQLRLRMEDSFLFVRQRRRRDGISESQGTAKDCVIGRFPCCFVCIYVLVSVTVRPTHKTLILSQQKFTPEHIINCIE